LSQIQDEALDLVLLGLELSSFGQLNTLKAAREASPATRFAIISAADTRAAILASLAAGFHGFISRVFTDSSG
jgi:DNA-binding NarL/FixJ family response regulator